MEADTLEMRAWRTLTSSPSAWYGLLFWSPLRCRFLAAFTMHFWIICCSDESTSAKSKTRPGVNRRPSPLIVLIKQIGVNQVNGDGLPTYISSTAAPIPPPRISVPGGSAVQVIADSRRLTNPQTRKE
jgi:hypothetical protein